MPSLESRLCRQRISGESPRDKGGLLWRFYYKMTTSERGDAAKRNKQHLLRE
jgi:hypothetical protein